MKEAVCLAINDYPGESNDLSECLNDAKDWGDLLKNLGFTVTTFLDSQVTINRFINELNRLIAKAVSGDYIVLTYSGHGTQSYDMGGDEFDYYDEAVYLYDGMLVDDILFNYINKLKDGVTLVIILDSCFSGTATRGLIDGTTKFMKPPRPKKKRKPNRFPKRRKRFLRRDIIKNILIAGCADNESSYDASWLGNGAFTYYAINVFRPGITYRDFYTELSKKLPTSNYPQTPQLEGPEELLDTPMFGWGITTDIPDIPGSDPIPDPPIHKGWWSRFVAWLRKFAYTLTH